MADSVRMFLGWIIILATLPGLVCGSKLGTWLSSVGVAEAPTMQPQHFSVALAQAIEKEQQSEHKLERVLAMIDTYKSLPSCSRLAWSNLITSCSDLDEHASKQSKMRTSEVALDKIRSKFAARLAVCELAAVSADIVPRPCSPFLQSEEEDDGKPYNKRRFGNENFQHDVCMHAIHADGRAWTSYSNAKQNAALVCEVSRKFMERDDMVDFQRSMLEVANQGLQTHAEHVKSMQNFSIILDNYINQFENAIRYNMEHTAYLADMLQSSLSSILAQVRDAGSSMQTFHSSVERTTAEIYNNEQAARDAQRLYNMQSEELLEAFAEAVERQQQEMEKHALTYGDTMQQKVKQHTDLLHADLQSVSLTAKGLANVFELGAKDALRVRENLGDSESKLSNIDQNLDKLQDKLDAFQIHEEEAHNNTIERYHQMFTSISLFGTSSMTSLLAWSLAAFGSWFCELPVAIVVSGYFCLFTFSTLLCAIVGRKLASIPFALIFAPIRIMWTFIRSAPWPLLPIISILSVYFACVEHPTLMIMRWSELAFNPTDAYLSLSILLPMLVYLGKSLHEDMKNSADDPYLGESGHAEKSKGMFVSAHR